MKMKTYEGSYRISAYAIFSIAYGNRLAVFFYLQIRAYSDIVTSLWARRCLKSPAPRLFAQPFVRVQIKENIKAPHHWPLWGESTGGRWIPLIKDQ